MSFLELHQLSKRFPGSEAAAVDGVDLSVEEGEFIVLLGPSGCGKTTTLRMIAGLEAATSGSIRLQGDCVDNQTPAQRDIGFVFQFFALYSHLSVYENIAFPLQSEGMPGHEVDRRVGEMADRLQLSSLLRRLPRGLSGGDQQRVALARALVRRPRLWLMDEPLGTLDGDRRLEMRELIRAQQLDLGVTTLYVTHDQEEAMTLADRIVVMEGGRIRQSAAAAEVYEQPIDLFVAHFMGSPGMNFLKGALEQEATNPVFVSEQGIRFGLSESALSAEDVTLGIRPEFVRVDPQGPLVGEVVLQENMGSHANLYVHSEAGRIVCRLPTDAFSYSSGEILRLRFDSDHIRLFDRRTGIRL
ncbi:MAG: ABC transporter ATP-binding protein [Candidatus Latescibacterota bacterium]|nr:ABC transporter ATP-binding protein [Candidatus Latescibacterota bacterium]